MDQRRGKAGNRGCPTAPVGRQEGRDRTFRRQGSEAEAEPISCRASGDRGGTQEAMGGEAAEAAKPTAKTTRAKAG